MTERVGKYEIPLLPPQADLKTTPVMDALVDARGALGDLNGRAISLPNPTILLNTLFLQEALASSEIENIVTTQDEVFRVEVLPGKRGAVEAKEVARYREAMQLGYNAWKKNRFISENMLIDMFRLLKQREDGYRKTSGTVIRNERTGETVHTPPQSEREVVEHMRSLERFINDDPPCNLNPLVKMAIIHHQFESIHPFPDGNGRIGRILNVLYLTHAGLLDSPILYLSRAINRTKSDYYRLLQAVRNEGAWEEWVVYMLKSVTATARNTLELVEGIRNLMAEYKNRMRDELPKIYSQDLLNNLFRHPYTRIEYVEKDLKTSRQTARKYLKQLAERGFVKESKEGRNNYYVNTRLTDLLLSVSSGDGD
ncbi:MAG: Fic family protein [Candidatus Dadabacteria bacterium]|nr:Fic family protein [Candidatus Dadabacteria bacterium]